MDTEIFTDDHDVEIDEGVTWWIAYLKGDPAGFCGILPAGYGDRCFLARAGVREFARGLGVHGRMLRVREIAARKLSYGRMITYTAQDNTASANNLIRAGYKVYRPAEEWGTENAMYFYKDL